MNNEKNFLGFNKEILAGILMFLSGVLGIIMVNTSLNEIYQAITDFTLKIGFGSSFYEFPLRSFIHHGLMVVFFAHVAMELKLEMNEGVISDRKEVILPAAAAIGGMLIPALVYYFFNFHIKKNLAGVAIPCATDIAFAVAIYNMFGSRLSTSVKIFLLSVAIFDDLGAIMIIALFYNSSFGIMSFMVAVAITSFIYLISASRVQRFWIYFVATCALWVAFHSAGIHTTMAGVIFGLALPLYNKDKSFSPLKAAMHSIHPWVSWVILPLFAFTACEIRFQGMQFSDILTPIAFGIASALFLGKQVGVFGSVYVLVKSGLASLPRDTKWWNMYFVSCLTGVGFTMSLFIGELAFPGEGNLQNLVKSGIIAGSLLSAIWAGILTKICSNSRCY